MTLVMDLGYEFFEGRGHVPYISYSPHSPAHGALYMLINQ